VPSAGRRPFVALLTSRHGCKPRQDPKGTACPAIDGIIKEANEVAGECENKKVLDAALIAAAQAVEHYEITRYGSMIAWSEELLSTPAIEQFRSFREHKCGAFFGFSPPSPGELHEENLA
jgi:hypothetical protein